MSLQLSGKQGGVAFEGDVVLEEGYTIQEVSPEDEADRSIEAIWATHSQEVNEAIRKMTIGA